jgi:hypothetical protein
MSRQSLGSVLALVTCVVGCGKRPAPLPPTYPVHGRVTYRNGSPLSGGLVQFFPEANPTVTTNATICSDGMYSLATMRNGLRAEGAVAGPNRVIVIPMHGNSDNRQADRTDTVHPEIIPTTYPTPYNVELRNNEFNLTVEPPPTKR